MANQYSAEEIKKFEEKDRRIGLQGLIQALLVTGAESKNIKEVCALAKEYQDEIYRIVQEQPSLDGKALPKATKKPAKKDKSVVPAPVLEEKKILDAVAEKLGVPEDDALRTRVRDWTFKQVGKEAYPKKLSSVDKIVEDLS